VLERKLALAAKQLYPAMRIAFVTGYAESEQLDAALGGNAAVLRKPFSMDQLADLIGSQLEAAPA